MLQRTFPGVRDNDVRSATFGAQIFEQSWNYCCTDVEGRPVDPIIQFIVQKSTRLKLRVVGESWASPRLLAEANINVGDDLSSCSGDAPTRVALPLLLDGRICGQVWFDATLHGMQEETTWHTGVQQSHLTSEERDLVEETMWKYVNGVDGVD